MKKENLLWIESLRVLATLGVIFVHVAAGALRQSGNVTDFVWWVGNIYDSSVRFCVPIFLMISGALILSKTYESTGEYLKKRVVRILFPLLFWSLVYIIRDIYLRFPRGEFTTTMDFVRFALLRLKNGASFHFWYMYMVIGLYLFFPIIGKWLSKSNKHEIKYFIGIWLFTVFAQLPFIKDFVPNIELAYFSGYLGLPILGYYLSRETISDSFKNRVTLILLTLTGLLITIFGTFLVTKHTGVFYEGFYEFLSPNVILVSAGLFLLFKNYTKFGPRASSVILFFSKYSYGIYLGHIFLLRGVMRTLGFTHSLINPVVGIFITTILCFIATALMVWAVNKLPFGKYVSG